jgi:hypothetical protein
VCLQGSGAAFSIAEVGGKFCGRLLNLPLVLACCVSGERLGGVGGGNYFHSFPPPPSGPTCGNEGAEMHGVGDHSRMVFFHPLEHLQCLVPLLVLGTHVEQTGKSGGLGVEDGGPDDIDNLRLPCKQPYNRYVGGKMSVASASRVIPQNVARFACETSQNAQESSRSFAFSRSRLFRLSEFDGTLFSPIPAVLVVTENLSKSADIYSRISLSGTSKSQLISPTQSKIPPNNRDLYLYRDRVNKSVPLRPKSRFKRSRLYICDCMF